MFHKLISAMLIGLCLALAPGAARGESKPTAGPFVDAFWLLQAKGEPMAAAPENDAKLKAALAKALGKHGGLTAAALSGWMEPAVFKQLAGEDGRLDASEVRDALEGLVPESRTRLIPTIREHAENLSTSFDMISEPHRAAGAKLVDWIAANFKPGDPLDVVVVCTGNSRRSMMGAAMGNIAAAYHGMPEVRFHSGGTAPSAFNARAIASLRAIGVEIVPTGEEAPRGEPGTANPSYLVRWGTEGAPAMEMVEFSKRYSDMSNPQSRFAALMVCSEADESCPFVKGASARISTPFLDPKIFDGSPFETAKYAERRDDIGRMMLSAMLQASQRIRYNQPAR